MGPIFLSVLISLLVYLLVVALIPREWLIGSGSYTKYMLDRLRAESAAAQGKVLPEAMAHLKKDDPSDNALVRAFLLLPGMQRAVPMLQKARLWKRLDIFVLGCLLVFMAFILLMAPLGGLAVPLALVATFFTMRFYVIKREARLRGAFMEQFPDALDSIVRSVRAGYPLTSAISLVGDNMSAPIGPEFKRVADETSYGWTLNESMNRLAERIGEPDVNFFTVVIGVQQESGGNLSEVLGNLSDVVRKRKQLRLKIRALSSEGRATAWILGSLPVIGFAIIYFVAPTHLDPLFDTNVGKMVLAGIVALIAFGMLIVTRMINIEA